MASTEKIQAAVNFAASHVDLMPLAGVGGYQDEPALTIAKNTIAAVLAPPFAWKFNQKTAPLFVTGQFRQDSKFAGACAFVLESPGGVGIGLASDSAISESGNTVTVNTLDPHNFSVGQTVYMAGNTVAAYNSTESVTLSGSSWSGGWVITAVPTTKSFQFTHASSGLAVSGAPGLSDFKWLESATMVSELDTAAPRGVSPIRTVRKLQTTGTVGRPSKVCVSDTSTTGVVSVRFDVAPDSSPWGVSLVYQMKAPTITSLDTTWAPIPDDYAHVCRQMFLAQAYRFANSPKSEIELQKAMADIGKALSSDDSEDSDEYMVPTFSLMDRGF